MIKVLEFVGDETKHGAVGRLFYIPDNEMIMNKTKTYKVTALKYIYLFLNKGKDAGQLT